MEEGGGDLGANRASLACFALLGSKTGLELHLTLEGYPGRGAGLPAQGQLHSPTFLVTNTHMLLLLASSTLGDPESLGRWERLVVSGTWLQGDLEGHTPPQAKAFSLRTGRHLRAALSDTEPHFSCLYLSITLPCGPCSLGTCQIYHLPETQYWPCSASRKVGLWSSSLDGLLDLWQ